MTGQTGVVKIGDLGLATISAGGAAKSVIGTPELAPKCTRRIMLNRSMSTPLACVGK